MSSPVVIATVWAGMDVYATPRLTIPSTAHVSPRVALYNQVIHLLQRQVVDDFGVGAEIVQVNSDTYTINVSKVQFQRQMPLTQLQGDQS